MKTIEIKQHTDPDFNISYNAIFIDGELFDWGIEQAELNKAKKFVGQDRFLKRTVHGDIQRYFLNCLSQFIGREITIQELNKSLEKGQLDDPSGRN